MRRKTIKVRAAIAGEAVASYVETLLFYDTGTDRNSENRTLKAVQNKLKNEYIFFRHVFLTNLWPCKAIDYVNNNLKNIEKNLNILNHTFKSELSYYINL